MHGNVPVRFGRGRLDSLGNKGLAAYLMRKPLGEPGSARPTRCAKEQIARDSSNPVAPTVFRDKPFGENVGGFFIVGTGVTVRRTCSNPRL